MKIIILDIFYIGVSHELCTWAKKFSKDIKHIYHLSNIIRKNITYNNFESKKERILIISNFKRQKNIEFAVELFATYLNNDDICFDIYGQPLDQRYLEKIKRKIDSKNLNDSILSSYISILTGNLKPVVNTSITEPLTENSPTSDTISSFL